MTLYEVIKNIQNIGEINHIASSFIGDIYELNHRQDIEYPAFVITQGTHQTDTENETDIYNLSLFLVDRLTEDKSNELDVQSWAKSGINSIINGIEATGISYQIRNQNIDTFTEKFNSLCAGAYANLYITIDQSCCCNEPNLVTSVNGQTGDVFIKGIEGGYVESINGLKGKVILDIPSKTSELENDSDFAINTDVEQKVNEAKEESISYTDERVNSLSDIEYNHYREIQGIFGQVGTDIEDLKSKDNLQDEELAKKIGEAPLDGSLYVRQNGDWESIYPPMIDALIDDKEYVRKNGEWKEITYNKNFYFSNLWFDEDDETVKYDNPIDLGDTVYGSYNKVLVIRAKKLLYQSTYTEDRIPCTFCGTMKDNQERQFTFIHNKQMYYCTLTPQKITTEKVIIEGSVTTEEFETYKTEQGERFDQVDAEIEATNTYISRVEENKQDVLVSGQNIKTVNGESLIGEGNIEIKGGEPYDDTEIRQEIADVKEIAESKTTMSEVESKGYLTEETEPKYTNDKPNIALKSEIPSLDGYATEQWVGEQGYLTEETEPKYTNDKPNIALKSEIPSLDGYATEQWVGEQGYLTEETEPIYTTDKPTLATKAELAVLEQKVDEIELVKTPNVTIFGTPTIQNGQVSNFSNSDYLKFPFLVDVLKAYQNLQIWFSITTGSSVSGQQNILDSNYGLALAIRDGHIVFVGSENGTSWTSGEKISENTVEPNTTYYFVLNCYRPVATDTSFMYYLVGSRNKIVSSEGNEFELLFNLSNIYPRQIFIGRSYADYGNYFKGSINLNDAMMVMDGITIWQGMDDVGLSTRLSTDLANIDKNGIAYINQMIDDKIGLISETLNTILGDE